MFKFITVAALVYLLIRLFRTPSIQEGSQSQTPPPPKTDMHGRDEDDFIEYEELD